MISILVVAFSVCLAPNGIWMTSPVLTWLSSSLKTKIPSPLTIVHTSLTDQELGGRLIDGGDQVIREQGREDHKYDGDGQDQANPVL